MRLLSFFLSFFLSLLSVVVIDIYLSAYLRHWRSTVWPWFVKLTLAACPPRTNLPFLYPFQTLPLLAVGGGRGCWALELELVAFEE